MSLNEIKIFFPEADAAVRLAVDGAGAASDHPGVRGGVDRPPHRGRRVRVDLPVHEVVLPGERQPSSAAPEHAVAVDGDVIAGAAFVDESLLTGESVPVDKRVGAHVFAGTRSRSGAVTIRATGVVSRSTEELEGDDDSGGKDISICIQLTDMSVNMTGTANAAKAAKMLYGTDDE